MSASISHQAYHNVTLFGAGGNNIGFHLAKVLSSDPAFTLTILARKSSKSTYPSNARVTRVSDDLTHTELVEALRNQDVLISAVGHGAKNAEYKLVEAAIEAGVKRFLPTEYGLDNSDPKNAAFMPVFGQKREFQQFLKTKEKDGLTWTAVATGLWLDWALTIAKGFAGIDIEAHTAAYWTSENTHTLSWSTLPYAARGVAEALKHPSETENQVIFVRAFEASQHQIVAELERQQAVKYEVSEVDAQTSVEGAKAKLKSDSTDLGAIVALVQAAFLLPDYGTDFAKANKNIANNYLGLPSISLEEVVREALKS